MRVSWTTPAADLEQIHYLSDRNPEAAADVVLRIYKAAAGLKQFPGRGRPGREEGTRELVLQALPYLPVYEVTDEMVRVLRVLHGARRWPE